MLQGKRWKKEHHISVLRMNKFGRLRKMLRIDLRNSIASKNRVRRQLPIVAVYEDCLSMTMRRRCSH
jgi:hypothetical protein